MKIKEVDVKDSAVFIADSHYKKGDKKFLSLLNNLLKKPPPQLFLLGDIFHLLLPFNFLYEYNKEAIELINKLSEKTEVYYIYGNHDFSIDKFFPKVIFADAFIDKKKSIYITHGDLDTESVGYRIYSFFIRKKLFLNLFNLLTFNLINNWLFKRILNKKVKCLHFSSDIDMNKEYKHIVIGHYHCFKKTKNIVIFDSFYCKRKYYIIHLRQKISFKEINYGR